MKIISVLSSTPHPDTKMDLLRVVVQYNNGELGESYLYRANYNALIIKHNMMKKYGISEEEMDNFTDSIMLSNEADHYYDGEGE